MFLLPILLLIIQISEISAKFSDFSRNCVDVEEYYRVPEEEDDVEPPVHCDDVAERGDCEIGWKSFQRPLGEWCMKNFYNPDLLYHVEAEKKCQEVGAKLSGLQNQVEAHWVADEAIKHNAPNKSYVMIGLKRVPGCQNVGRTQNCTAMNSFEWTDKSTTGTDGIVWSSGQPDNAYNKKQHCAVLMASNTGYMGSLSYQSGTLDDVICEKTDSWKKPWVSKAYVCGKKP